jgi:hypothetical protein
MDPEASSGSERMNNSMEFQPIEVQLALNWHPDYYQMAAIVGSPNFDSNLYSQKRLFHYSSVYHDLFIMHTLDSTFAEIRYRLLMICVKLHAIKIRGGWQLAGHQSSH